MGFIRFIAKGSRSGSKNTRFLPATLFLAGVLCPIAACNGMVTGTQREVVVEKQSVVSGVYKVEELKEGPSDQRRIIFSTLGEVELPRTDSRRTTWWKILEQAKNSDKPVYVELLEPGKVGRILLPAKRRVEAVAKELNDDRLVVTLYMAPSLYFIRKMSPRFSELKKTLETSAASKAEVLVVIDPATLEILQAQSIASANAN
jgi:hypothetical protein